MFQIQFTSEAIEDLRQLRTYEQRRLIQAIDSQLLHQPTQPTQNRKLLRLNILAQWELRVDTMRLFYDVDTALSIVTVIAIGYKPGQTLWIRGEEFEL